MKKFSFALALLIFSVSNTNAADVRLESLEAFDINAHKISISLQEKVRGGCLPGSDSLEAAYISLLEQHGFTIAAFKESHLEFAVSIEGFKSSGPEDCGLVVLSMVRQVPLKKILRLPPDSKSTLYRLWTEENLVTGKQSEMRSLVQHQAIKDVSNFFHAFELANN